MTNHQRLRLMEDRARVLARQAAYKARKEAKRDFIDFIRFWWVELVLAALFNFHMSHVVSHVSGMWPW